VMQAGATQAHDCATSELHGYDFSVPPEPRRPKHIDSSKGEDIRISSAVSYISVISHTK